MYDKIIQAWLEEAIRRPDLSRSTKTAYRRVGQHLLAWKADTDDVKAITGYVAARREAGTAPRTMALELRVL